MRSFILLLFTICFFAMPMSGQKRAEKQEDKKEKEEKVNLKGLEWRNIGPAFASGRIADIAMHPQNENVWYVAVGSGGVWKTENSGTTWKPIFDGQSTYSTGCVTIDPSINSTIWVGTGENVGGRHVGFGDGIYKSTDDGSTWKNMGLKDSEHISKIIVHPDDSEVIFVAAQGPLWSKGGERGFYKSTDGGETWNKTLGDDEWTGVTDIVMDPTNSDIIYAATWDRHRTVAAYMGGGPGSGIHRSMDGGETWTALTNGIPGSNLGKIGLAISPFDNETIYAAIELDRTKGGLFMSENMGASWKKMSDAVSGATGPHYYQELYASPHYEGTIYLMDVRIQVSHDHGKTFDRLKESDKHSDNHYIGFRKDEPGYLLVGTDAGIYESHDNAENWRFIDNLPITQYYKVAVDDSEPFYMVYGGTQDNGSHGGPSRTDNRHGIRNADWFKTLGADGHQSATEPGNPNIMYAETQQGGLHRVDRITGEQVNIQPKARPGEKFERFNWDAPIVVSPHQPSRLYFASYRVWKSDDRGDSWTAISGDLTKDQERISLPIMGKVQSWDNPWDVNAMSNYNTISSLAESPIQAGLLYVGTDDGIFQVSENDGQSWMKVELGSISGMPATAFVNNVYADLHDSNVVYLAADNHKYGDFKPYLFKSTDKGKSWKSMVGDLPDRHLVWRVVQDHEDPNLLFAATEFGVFYTKNNGANWTKLSSGMPTIPIRDITIQRRENDLVAASFGRGFYILDNYTPLRQLDDEVLKKEAHLFPVKDALWYEPKSVVGTMGASYYTASNPEHGATFTYYLKDDYPTMASERKKAEKELMKESKDIPFPGWEALADEKDEEEVMLVFTVKDASGNVVNVMETKPKKGVQRVTWDMTRMSKSPVTLPTGRGRGFGGRGFNAQPGKYSVSMGKKEDGVITDFGEMQEFELVPLRDGALPSKPKSEVIAFRKEFEDFQERMTEVTTSLQNAERKHGALETALSRVDKNYAELSKMVYDAAITFRALDRAMNGDPVKDEIGERYAPTPRSAMWQGYGALNSTYGPTQSQIDVVKGAEGQLEEIAEKVEDFHETLKTIADKMEESGAPWIEGF
ncbi:WD40/YVTN/BNR-like repeat-containing protein [Portibacter marinus]|uniref:WD40/YVTN/BNR-like repeat-containing protein n=1 Tax=Portibacter marinus TaxID=2898660 RepID=UPI001F29CEE9|nr:glycosyl hydrolase [Portibacter marinus]